MLAEWYRRVSGFGGEQHLKQRVPQFVCRATLECPFFGDVTTIEMSPILEASTGGGQMGKGSDE
jgi:hypothetical protein